MKNKKNNDVKKPEEVVLNNPFDPAYESENCTESIENDPFFNDDKEHDASSKKHGKEKYYKKYYGGEIGDSAQYPGGHI